MIDEATHHVPDTMLDSGDTFGATTTTSMTTASSLEAPWNGRVQHLVGIGGDSSESYTTTANTYLSAAATLAYSPYSRYQNDPEQLPGGTNHSHQSSSFQPGHHDKNGNPRHVIWDDDMEEEEEDEEERRERLAREQENERRRRLEWQTQTAVPLAHELDLLMEQRLVSLSSSGAAAATAATSGSSSPFTSQNDASSRRRPIHWTDIWMPPRSEKSRLILPYSTQSKLVPHWDVIYSSGSSNSMCADPPFLRDWKQDVLGEAVRHMLEGCDYGIQGATITAEGTGIYASLTSFLLDELHEECKSAGRMVYHVRTNNGITPTERNAAAASSSSSGGVDDDDAEEVSWQQAQVRRVREHISSGLALYDFTQKAHVVLPLRLHDGENESIQQGSLAWFQRTAQVAMTLEGCTLPFRFQISGRNHISRPQYQLGLQNAPFMTRHGSIVDTHWGSTAPRLTVAEYLAMLQPSSSHCMLELDTVATGASMSPGISNQELYTSIKEGTSVERDLRMRERGEQAYRSRPLEVPPGAWLQDRCSSTVDGGLLSSMSYSSLEQDITTNRKNGGKPWDRSAHHHFALSTSVRSLVLPKNDDPVAMSNYLTCLVEGMGVRYCPERSMGTVLNQCLGQLTFPGNLRANAKGSQISTVYAAGVYWKHILPAVDTPVVAVLGNTTRAYYSLNMIAADMKSAMRGPRFRGYYNRDLMNGVLPELEDCDEALEGCWNKRDVYQPPGGAGGLDQED